MAWIQDLGWVGIERPYIWPGSWPDADLRQMGHALPTFPFDSAWIYYEAWDPEIPAAIERFNQDHATLHARVIHRDGVWRPPRDVVCVIDRTRSDHLIMSMWLSLGER